MFKCLFFFDFYFSDEKFMQGIIEVYEVILGEKDVDFGYVWFFLVCLY